MGGFFSASKPLVRSTSAAGLGIPKSPPPAASASPETSTSAHATTATLHARKTPSWPENDIPGDILHRVRSPAHLRQPRGHDPSHQFDVQLSRREDAKIRSRNRNRFKKLR